MPELERGADGRSCVVLVDGRSGSGKTEFARALVCGWSGAQLLRLDDIYRGWDGLDDASRRLPGILRSGRWQAWDWQRDRPGAVHTLDLARPIVVEGVGALTRASRKLAHHAFWIELDAEARKRRAIGRDGDAYAPHWDRWARQEDDLIARENPSALADTVLDGNVLDRLVLNDGGPALDAARWRRMLVGASPETATSESGSMGE